jgi:hypothetical protein
MPNFVKGPTFAADMKEAMEVVRSGNFTALNVTDLVVTNAAVKSGTYTMVAADDTAGSKAIATGLTSISTFIVQFLNASGVVVGADAVLTASGGNITIADGSSYKLTAGHFAKWIAVGTL